MYAGPPIILASSSVYRKQQLDSLNVNFSVINPDIDEQAGVGESAEDLVMRLATEKAQKAQIQSQGSCVIGADQVCVFAHQIYGKPGDHKNAIKQLQLFSNQTVEFLTALCVVDATGERLTHLDRTVVVFRSLTESEITRYVEKERPFNCAGSFKVESLGLSLFSAVESKDPSALMGLPLIKLCEFLRLAVAYPIP